MKPKIFIGSSVEGLSVAYAIQQNLVHDAEVTVWTQGVFELSQTTIESLNFVLESSDFGIFVFSPDDISIIRDKENLTVRDNVIFEFGLFIGKLSRERVFFIIPSGIDFHLPTDLLGITPGTYDSNREDKSLQAATGPVCHQIRGQIKKLGFLNEFNETLENSVNNLGKEKEEKEEKDRDTVWVEVFVNKNYEKAITDIETKLETEDTPTKIIYNKILIAYCKFKLDNDKEGYNVVNEIIERYNANVETYKIIAAMYWTLNYYNKAIEILNIGLGKFNTDYEIITLLASYYVKNGDDDLAEDLLKAHLNGENANIFSELFEIIYTKENYIEAKEIIHQAYLKFPQNEQIRYSYARLSIDMNENETALYLLDSLTKDFPLNSDYWGYLSNCCVNLELYDIAMISCRKANEIAEEKQSWIIMNIGNILKNKGFYTESISYFEKGLEIDKFSEYGHDRLSSSLKLAQEEKAKAKELIKEGRKILREFNIDKEESTKSTN